MKLFCIKQIWFQSDFYFPPNSTAIRLLTQEIYFGLSDSGLSGTSEIYIFSSIITKNRLWVIWTKFWFTVNFDLKMKSQGPLCIAARKLLYCIFLCRSVEILWQKYWWMISPIADLWFATWLWTSESSQQVQKSQKASTFRLQRVRGIFSLAESPKWEQLVPQPASCLQ